MTRKRFNNLIQKEELSLAKEAVNSITSLIKKNNSLTQS